MWVSELSVWISYGGMQHHSSRRNNHFLYSWQGWGNHFHGLHIDLRLGCDNWQRAICVFFFFFGPVLTMTLAICNGSIVILHNVVFRIHTSPSPGGSWFLRMTPDLLVFLSMHVPGNQTCNGDPDASSPLRFLIMYHLRLRGYKYFWDPLWISVSTWLGLTIAEKKCRSFIHDSYWCLGTDSVKTAV